VRLLTDYRDRASGYFIHQAWLEHRGPALSADWLSGVAGVCQRSDPGAYIWLRTLVLDRDMVGGTDPIDVADLSEGEELPEPPT
jgi:hypothetical protein